MTVRSLSADFIENNVIIIFLYHLKWSLISEKTEKISKSLFYVIMNFRSKLRFDYKLNWNKRKNIYYIYQIVFRSHALLLSGSFFLEYRNDMCIIFYDFLRTYGLKIWWIFEELVLVLVFISTKKTINFWEQNKLYKDKAYFNAKHEGTSKITLREHLWVKNS